MDQTDNHPAASGSSDLDSAAFGGLKAANELDLRLSVL